MSNAPQIIFNGESTTSLNITTNSTNLLFSGISGPNTIDIQVNINNSGWVSDPTLVSLTSTADAVLFTIPNPLSNPAGFRFEVGVNTVALRAIDSTGSSSEVSSISINTVPDVSLSAVLAPPTGVTISRTAKGAIIKWSDETTPGVAFFNVYASLEPGGGTTGYLRLNLNPVSASTPTVSEITAIDTATATFDFTETSITDKDVAITISTVDSSTGQELERKVVNRYPLLSAPSYQVNVDFSRTQSTNYYEFVHDRNATLSAGILNSDTFSAVPNSEPLYYVVTALYYDSNSILQESRYSIELVAAPLPIDTSIRGIPIRDQSSVATEYIATLQTVSPELSLIPGSTVREVHVEPFANEIQKAYFLMDFVHRSKSFPALLAIDDPTLSGVSIPVSESAYKSNLKTAIASATDQAVQSLINASFDSLAANYAIIRQGAKASQVVQTFYVNSRPTSDLYVNQNAVVRSTSDLNAPRFISRGYYVLPSVTAERYYNPQKRRYEIKVPMYADTPGADGNVAAGVLNQISSGASGFSGTVNEAGAFAGSDQQSNLDLAEAGMRALVSLDTGTRDGYASLVASVPGVLSYEIVSSGDPYMMRDYDPVRQKHIGGKVDIYVKGDLDRVIEETFAFEFDVVNNMRFDVVDSANLIFRARDSRLTPDNPIQEMLYNPSQGLGLYNFSSIPTSSYDLTGVVYVDYRTIKLSTLLPQPTTEFDDFITGSYRYRSNNKLVPNVQPIRSITSVVGQSTGALEPGTGFNLYKTQDPLLEGESTIAKDYVEINQVNDIPTGVPIQVTNEEHVLIGSIFEPLNSVGINLFTLNVYSETREILYSGPDSESPDYLVVPGTTTTPVQIYRTTFSTIPDGSTVSVDYEHDENFAVTYVVNDVLQRAQDLINLRKHITADVLVKQAIENPLYIESTIQLKPNTVQSTVDSDVRSSFSVMINNKKVGDDVHVSDVTAAFDNAPGVNFVVQPFSRLTLLDGALRTREAVPNDYTFISSLSSGSNAVYILDEPLEFATIDGGGTQFIHRGVFKDSTALTRSASLDSIASNVYQWWIIGNQGAIIEGYSDDATLAPVFITQSAIAAERLKRTANKVVVSLNFAASPPEVPSDYGWSASYQVFGDTSSKDVYVSQIEYLTPGTVTITYRAA